MYTNKQLAMWLKTLTKNNDSTDQFEDWIIELKKSIRKEIYDELLAQKVLHIEAYNRLMR